MSVRRNTRPAVDRNDQRAARALMENTGLSFMQAKAALLKPVEGWLKAMHYFDDGWTIEPGETTWISDVGRRTASGARVYRADGTEWGEPSWKEGDEVGLYFGGTYKVPVLVRVLGPPEFDPGMVQRESHGQEPDAGERWPWVTWVQGVSNKKLSEAPTLADLGIDSSLMMRRARLHLTVDEHRRMVRALH